MQKRIFLSLFLSLVGLTSQAQTDITTTALLNDPNTLQKIEKQGAIYFPSPPPTDIEGSVYFSETYLNSEIILENNVRLKGVALRYNILHDAMEFLEKNELRALYKTKIKRVNLGGEVFEVVKTNEGNKEKLIYLKCLTDSSKYVFEKLSIQVEKPYYNPAINSSRPNRKVTQKTTTYIRLDETAPALAIRSKKNVLALLGKKDKVVEAYAKANNLSFKKLEDIEVLIAYYHTL